MTLSRNPPALMLLLILVFSTGAASAQKEFSIWLFGTNNGIDFRSGSPVAITNPTLQMFDYEGVTTRCDANGNLLFYSDGNIVYNRQHQVMPNGSGLNGNLYAAQASLTVRAIHDTTLFYLFTLDYGGGTNPMSYSIVDMKADNGLGDVSTKNVPLLSNPTEKMCAVKHCNGRDVWVITHQWQSDAYYAYLVKPAGVSTTPVISHSGRQVVPGSFGYGNKDGCMKTSPDGKKIAAAFESSGVDLSDFDNATGVVSNSIALPVRDDFFSTCYGLEFSPNSRFLYTGYLNYTTSKIFQFDVLAGTFAAIISSKTTIADQTFFGYVSALQRGPDGKIYVANYGTNRVSIIHQPNNPGAACNFEWDGLQLIGGSSSHGFPAFIETHEDPVPVITYTAACPIQRIKFHYSKPSYITGIKWDFDDPASGSANTSTDPDPVHEFTDERSYLVKLIRFTPCSSDTIQQRVDVRKLSVNLGNDTALCAAEGYILKPLVLVNVDYLWQDGSTASEFIARSPGIYWLQVTDKVSGCTVRDSVRVTFNVPSVSVGPDTTICEDKTLLLDAGSQGSEYTWQDGSKKSTYTVRAAGLYFVTVKTGNCTASDSIQINFSRKPQFSIGDDRQFCNGDIIVLGEGLDPAYSYAWEDGSTSPARTVKQPGWYKITASNGCGATSDEVIVKPGPCLLAVPNAFTPDGDGKNDVFKISKTSSLSAFVMQVFNRWGQKIFETRDQSQGWDGTFGGKKCDNGNYAYFIQYRAGDGTLTMLKGMVLVVR